RSVISSINRRPWLLIIIKAIVFGFSSFPYCVPCGIDFAKQVLQWRGKTKTMGVHLCIYIFFTSQVSPNTRTGSKKSREQRPRGRIPELFLPVLIKIGDFAR